MDRRDFLAAWIQALLLAIFPFLRARPLAQSAAIAEAIVDKMPTRVLFKGGEFKISALIKGYDVDWAFARAMQHDPAWFDALEREPDAPVR